MITTSIKQAHRKNRLAQSAGHRGRTEWRAKPATREQRQALQELALRSGVTFATSITRGQAWRRIKEANRTLSPVVRRRCAPPWWTGQ